MNIVGKKDDLSPMVTALLQYPEPMIVCVMFTHTCSH